MRLWLAWRLPLPAAVPVLWKLEKRWGKGTHHVVDAHVRPGDVVVDAGANYGAITARMARLAGPSGRVHAFEPDASNHASIERLTRSARTAPVTVHGAGLSDRAGSMALHIPLLEGRRRSALASLTPPDGPHERLDVPLVRLDDALAAESRRIAFLKIDVEGHELPVLRGAPERLARDRPAVLVEIEHRLGSSVEEVAGLLAEHGYSGQVLAPGGPRPLAEFDLERDQLRHLGPSFSPLHVPDGYLNDFLFSASGAGS